MSEGLRTEVKRRAIEMVCCARVMMSDFYDRNLIGIMRKEMNECVVTTMMLRSSAMLLTVVAARFH